jgi:hypothetical protein
VYLAVQAIKQWLTAEAACPALVIKVDPGVGKSALVDDYGHGYRRK